MKKNIIHKVPEGKLLRIEVEIKNSTIKEIEITGDFFIHPEKDLLKIEKKLKGVKVNQVKKVIKKFIKENKTKIVGFSPEDLQKALLKKE